MNTYPITILAVAALALPMVPAYAEAEHAASITPAAVDGAESTAAEPATEVSAPTTPGPTPAAGDAADLDDAPVDPATIEAEQDPPSDGGDPPDDPAAVDGAESTAAEPATEVSAPTTPGPTPAAGDAADLDDAPVDPATIEAEQDPPSDGGVPPDDGAPTAITSPPVAKDVDLSEPVVEPQMSPSEPPAQSRVDETRAAADSRDATPAKVPLVLLGEEVAPGTSARLSWSLDQRFDGITVPTPVLVVNGRKAGKVLCLTAAVHGDELNGIEIVRRVLYDLDPEELSGTVIGVPIVNLQGFRRNSRYLPDRRDLNRYFPGSQSGSSAARIAHSFFTHVISTCNALVDIHTGSFQRSNLPQLRANMRVPEVAALTEGFGATAVLHSVGKTGTLRRAAVDSGIPAVTLETGGPGRLQEKEIEHGAKGIHTLLNKLDLTRRVRVWGEPEPVYYQSIWVRANHGGLLFREVKLGQRVRKNQLLATVTDPITNVRNEIRAPTKGRILGLAVNQVVLPGFAAFRIGIPTTETEVANPDGGNVDTAVPAPAGEMPQGDDTIVSADTEDENS